MDNQEVYEIQLTDMEKWMLVVGSLIGGLTFEGIVAYLERFKDLDTALIEALKYRGHDSNMKIRTKEERRSKCDKCGSKNLKWIPWGSYLDKDLVCQVCGYIQDIWDC